MNYNTPNVSDEWLNSHNGDSDMKWFDNEIVSFGSFIKWSFKRVLENLVATMVVYAVIGIPLLFLLALLGK